MVFVFLIQIDWFVPMAFYSPEPTVRDQASSPKRVRWTMQRGEDGAAVEIVRRSKPKNDFGHRKR